MKKSKVCIITLLILFLAMIPFYQVKAADKPNTLEYRFSSGGLQYEISKEAGSSGQGEVRCLGADNKKLTSVVLPDTVKNMEYTYKVTSIHHNAFKNQKELTSVSIPDSVNSLGEMVFAGCTKLEQITLPDSIEAISFGLFYECTSLKQVQLPAKLTFLPMYTFFRCTALETVNIPDSITLIQYGAFQECTSLTKMTLPSLAVNINENTFRGCTSLEEVKLPEELQVIPQEMFYGCTALKEINLPEALTSIREEAFSQCSGLTEIKLPDQVNSLGNGAFNGCTNLKEIYLSKNLTVIPEKAFMNCKSITGITIPEKVTAVEAQAFADCTSLKEISLPEGIIDFYRDSLQGTAAANNNTEAYLVLNGILIDGSKAKGAITIPDEVKYIANGAFADNTAVTGVTVGKSVNKIGSYAFSGCTSITKVKLPDTLKAFSEGIFNHCTKLTAITLPSQITEIPEKAFYQCSSLKEIILPVRIKEIGDYAFSECNSITKISIPKNVKQVGRYAFASCKLLKSVSVASESLLRYSFASCPALTSVTMTDDVRNVGMSAFRDCKKLSKVTLSKRLTVLDYHLFSGCSSLTSIRIPNSVEYILKGAFQNCKKLKYLITSKNLIYTDAAAFEGCKITKTTTNKDKAFTGKLLDSESTSIVAVSSSAIQQKDSVYYISGAPLKSRAFRLIKRSSGGTKNIGEITGQGMQLQGNYLYYLYNRKIYRIPVNGGKSTAVISKAVNILKINSKYLYYINDNKVYRADLNGKNQKLIFSLPVWTDLYGKKFYDVKNLEITDEKIYYLVQATDGTISIECRDVDGSNKKLISENCPIDINQSRYDRILYSFGKRLYFITTDRELAWVSNTASATIKVLTKGNTVIKEITEDAIYYTNQSRLLRVSAEGMVEVLLNGETFPLLEDIDTEIAVSSDGTRISICYTGQDESSIGRLYVMKSDGSEKRLITEADTLTDLEMIGDYIYYFKDFDYENGPITYMRTRYK